MDGNKSDFLVAKSYLVHNTEFTEVFAQLVTIKGKPYIGLQRKCFRSEEEKELNHQIQKSILIPIEAWNTVISQASPVLLKEAKRIQKNPNIQQLENSILSHLKKVQANNGMQTVLIWKIFAGDFYFCANLILFNHS